MVKIGLIDVDSKIPNLALMKLSAYHKARGDHVEFFSPLFNYDKIYASKIFTKSEYNYFPKNTIKGGSGVSLDSKLPDHIEHIYPDYSLYQEIDYAMGYLTRGCINKCPFCIVWKKEGKLHKHADLEEFWDGQKKVMLLDNALTDFENAEYELKKIRDLGLRLNLTQGFNVRTIKSETAKILSEIKLWKGKQWHIAWDNFHDEKSIMKGIRILNQAGIKNWKIMCYVLVGFKSSPREDVHRVLKLDKMGIDPFVMCYEKNKFTKHLARWCNRPQIRRSSNSDLKKYLKSRGCDVSFF